jgi:hypothetical protein
MHKMQHALLELLLVQHATIQAIKNNLTLEATLLVKQLVDELNK